jgi:hypothetical protein
MTECVKCGHELGVGRYCTNCGHPVDAPATGLDDLFDWRTGTAERPSASPPTSPAASPATSPAAGGPVVPPTPPPAWTPPPATRFPLFADEVEEGAPVDVADQPGRPATQTSHRRSRPWGMWVAVAAVLAVVAVLGVWLLGTGDDDSPSAKDPASSAPATSAGAQPSASESGSAPSTGTPAGLTADSQVTVPATAKANRDVDGNPVDYEGANMLDGVPETCWRMPGDGTGKEVVITLPAETRLRSVGLINGYAKAAKGRDWYHGNRRILKVEWVFDDGTTVPQDLDDSTSVQSVDVDTTTTTITLRLVSVSKPGTGSDKRDFTAISDLLFVAG